MTPSFPELRTERFLLRRIRQSDLPLIFRGLSHPDVIRYYGVSCQTIEDTQSQLDWYDSLLTNQTGIWRGICFPDRPDALIGACGLNYWAREHQRAEMGFWLLPEHWGQGIMPECAAAVIQHAFSTMNLHRIEAVVEEENRASARLLQKLGFVYEGTHRDQEIKQGRYINLMYFALLNPVDTLENRLEESKVDADDVI